MIKNQVLSQCETLVYDHTNEEFPKWINKIKDRRDIKDLGNTAIDIFNLDDRDVKPVYMCAKTFVSGTTSTTNLRILLNNRDFLKFTRTDITSLASADELEPIIEKHSLLINGEKINFRDFDIRDRCLSQNITLDFIRDFYFNYWIPSENEKN